MDKLWRRVKRLQATGRKEEYDDEDEERRQERKAKKLSAGGQELVEEEDLDGASSISSAAANEQNDKRPVGQNDHQTAAGSGPQTTAQRPAAQQHQPGAGAFYDCLTPMTRSRLYTLAQIGEDWLYLALLGIIMALLSIFMDSIITMFLSTRIWLSEEIRGQNLLLEYAAWCLVPILLVSFSTGFVHLCSPTAIGSGIPEMKTILRGVVLNEYLTFRTLVAKIVGLTFTLGSGLPLGKEGPSVHMASIVATLLSKLVASFQGIYENESRTSEMLSAACAVGVAATFYAPIGGVLFSIEVTTVYFAVRNYWRGFFAACCGATIWRLLGFYIQNDESISAIFKTNFQTQYPFDPVELLLFSFIGATCGLAAAAYIKFHREIVQFFRRHERISGFLQQNRFVYPTLVTLIITTSTFPPLMGRYTAATLSTHTTIEHLFSNRTWSLGSQDLASKQILDAWTTDSTGFHLHLILYILMLFWTSALASTIPTPSGVFIPVVKMGAAYGRLVGELMAAAYPAGIQYSHPAMIVPGSYAVVGAAAFSGAVTHTVSTSVILFEMTGQIVHIIPVILGVLISNAVCQSLQPSIYDSIIEIKKLPYLPPIASSNSISHRILVKDFMNKKNIPFIWKERCTYADLKALLSSHRKIISFPLVESPDSMKLLGSVARPDLLKLLYLHLGRERRLQEVCRRNSDTLTPAIHLLSTITSGRHNSTTATTINEHDYDSDNNQQMKECDLAKEKPATGHHLEEDLEGAKGNADASSLSSEGIGGIEFISVKDLEKTQRQQQNNQSTQLMGHVTVLPAAAAAAAANTTDCEQPIPMASRPRAATTTASTSSVTTVTSTCGSSGSESKVDDCDPTRLIISACTNCHKYGATSMEMGADKPRSLPVSNTNSNSSAHSAGVNYNKQTLQLTKSSPINSTRPKLSEEQLLNDCQKRVNAYEEAEKEFAGVAKYINHYDRGSSMDKDHLEKSIQEVEDHLASIKHTLPEIVVVVDSWLDDRNNTTSGGQAKEPQQTGGSVTAASSKQPLKRLSLLQPPEQASDNVQSKASFRRTAGRTKSQGDEHQGGGGGDHCADGDTQAEPKPKLRRPAELRVSPAATPNLYHHPRRHQPLSHSVSSSPSLSPRPFKSILKTSSCNNMAKRPMSVAQSPNINMLHSSMKHKRPSGVLVQDQTGGGARDLDSTTNNNGLSVISKQVTGTTNQLSNLRFANPPELRRLKSGGTLGLDLEAGLDEQLQRQQIRQRRKVRLPRLRVVDMTPEEQEQWEKEQLSAFIELDKCQIDEAPFQLVEQTSLYRVHTLFSMLGLNHAYVTSFGRLVGIVALKDIRYAIEKMLQSKV